jgi:hypothetical protein
MFFLPSYYYKLLILFVSLEAYFIVIMYYDKLTYFHIVTSLDIQIKPIIKLS